MIDYKEGKIKVPRFSEAEGFYTTPEKSRAMSKIRSKDTKPELLLRRALWAKGHRYRLRDKRLPGSPDIVFRKYKLVVFVDGDFWHGYDWEAKKGKLKTNRGFWIPKIERNMQRDKENNEELESMGWKVLRFWESSINKELDSCVAVVEEHLVLPTNKNH
ncbi:MAG: very short patch repair endonuclease [Chlorobi bacterium]|nr:very short patch repair endonuclease [Chlorobiota bacterium]